MDLACWKPSGLYDQTKYTLVNFKNFESEASKSLALLCVQEDLLVAWVWAATNPLPGLIDTYVLFHRTVQRKLGDNMTLEQFLMMGC